MTFKSEVSYQSFKIFKKLVAFAEETREPT